MCGHGFCILFECTTFESIFIHLILFILEINLVLFLLIFFSYNGMWWLYICACVNLLQKFGIDRAEPSDNKHCPLTLHEWSTAHIEDIQHWYYSGI